MRTIRFALATTAVSLAALAVPTLPSVASASTYCTPSIFHPTISKYTNWQRGATVNRTFGQASPWYYNSHSFKVMATETLSVQRATSIGVSASTSLKVSDIVTSIDLTFGVNVSTSVTTGRSFSAPVWTLPHTYGWLIAVVPITHFSGTVTQTDLVCNRVLYRGPVSVNVATSSAGFTTINSTQPPPLGVKPLV